MKPVKASHDKQKTDVLRTMDRFSAFLIAKTGIMGRYPGLLAPFQLKISALQGSAGSMENAQLLLYRILTLQILSITLLLVLGGVIGNFLSFLLSALILAVFVYIYHIRSLDDRLKRKKRRILTELPELLNKLVLLVNAGETVQGALFRCLPEDPKDSPLYLELQKMVNDLSNNHSLQQVMEEFGKRCSIQEVSLFTTTVLLNYRRGGEDFVHSLRELNRGLWEKRKALAKTLGEEASAKLVFPMVGIFLIVTVIVAAPAVLLMNQN